MRRRKNLDYFFPWPGSAWDYRGDSVIRVHPSTVLHLNPGYFVPPQHNTLNPSNYMHYNPGVYNPPQQKLYAYNPFQTPQVKMLYDCHPWGARDLHYPGIQWDAPVYAVEDGQVVFIYTGSNCFSKKTSLNSATTPARDPQGNLCQVANSVAIRGADGYFTEYVHVKAIPQLQVCSSVRAGELIGHVDNSSNTPQPHVHLARYFPNPSYQCNPNPSIANSSFRGNPQGANGTCDWWMVGLS